MNFLYHCFVFVVISTTSLYCLPNQLKTFSKYCLRRNSYAFGMQRSYTSSQVNLQKIDEQQNNTEHNMYKKLQDAKAAYIKEFLKLYTPDAEGKTLLDTLKKKNSVLTGALYGYSVGGMIGIFMDSFGTLVTIGTVGMAIYQLVKKSDAVRDATHEFKRARNRYEELFKIYEALAKEENITGCEPMLDLTDAKVMPGEYAAECYICGKNETEMKNCSTCETKITKRKLVKSPYILLAHNKKVDIPIIKE